MTAVGVGVGVGFGGQGLSPDWLEDRLVADCGAELVGLWIGSDQTVADGVITAWPGRVGGALTNGTAARFTQAAVNGRAGMSPLPTISEIKTLGVDNGVVARAMIVVAEGCAATNSYEGIADGFSDSTHQGLVRLLSTAAWNDNGWTHFRNGVVDETIPTSGLHIFGAEKSNNSKTGAKLGGWGGGLRSLSR
jgi:hypothetical protein